MARGGRRRDHVLSGVRWHTVTLHRTLAVHYDGVFAVRTAYYVTDGSVKRRTDGNDQV